MLVPFQPIVEFARVEDMGKCKGKKQVLGGMHDRHVGRRVRADGITLCLSYFMLGRKIKSGN